MRSAHPPSASSSYGGCSSLLRRAALLRFSRCRNCGGLDRDSEGFMAVRLESVQPVLASSDVAASISFYERLGFKVAFRDRAVDPKYVALRRDGVELHLQWHD